MTVVKKKMNRKQRDAFASKMAHEFLQRCDGMNAMDVFDILHEHYLYCMNFLCESVDINMCEALERTKEFVDDVIDDIHNHDKKLN